ncbi:MAG TPA: ABC transporter permease [Gaiellaceae bacterium]|nr:ABC transporter permease [Gaiellaceae bacterium]
MPSDEETKPGGASLRLAGLRGGGRLSFWLIGIRDLQWRRRRFALAAVAASMTLALALLLSGVGAALDSEAGRTVASFHADAWLVRSGSSGPFTSPAPFPVGWLARVRQLPGVRAAAAVVIGGATVSGPHPRQVNLIGMTEGVGAGVNRFGVVLRRGSALVDTSLGIELGSRLVLNGVRLRATGLLHGRTYFAGVPTVVVALREAQLIAFRGLPLATAIVTRGSPRQVPAGLARLQNRQVVDDLSRPILGAEQTILLIRLLLWVVAGAIIGTFVYLSALERAREIAVLKAIGIGTLALMVGLIVQALAAGLLASLLAIGLETALAPASDLSVAVPTLSYLLLPLLAAGIALVASLAALRRTLAVDPVLAFGSA